VAAARWSSWQEFPSGWLHCDTANDWRGCATGERVLSEGMPSRPVAPIAIYAVEFSQARG